MHFAAECQGDVSYVLYDALGHEIFMEKTNLISGQNKTIELGRDLPAGTYMLSIEFGGKSMQRSIIKMSRT
jgi:hypothetical protein